MFFFFTCSLLLCSRHVGYEEEHAHRILLEAEFDVDEGDAYGMALTHVEAI